MLLTALGRMYWGSRGKPDGNSRWIVCGISLALAMLVNAQEPAKQRLSFEVASVKLSDPGSKRSGLSVRSGNDLSVQKWPLRNLIKFAFSLQDFQLAGAPKWVNTDDYDIIAKAPRDEFLLTLPTDSRLMTEDQFRVRGERLRERVRSLLAERFALVVHHELTARTVYRLEVSKAGSKIVQVLKPGDRQGIDDSRPGHAQAYAATMDMLSHTLSTALGTIVTDETHLDGQYDFLLDWVPENDVMNPATDDSQHTSISGPSLFTAVQQQLGLKLVPQKGTVDLLVIDRVSRPSEN